MFRCYQWLIIDHQQMSFPSFVITKKHYVDKRDVWEEYGPDKTEYCFRPIRPIKESKLEGNFAEEVYYQERK